MIKYFDEFHKLAKLLMLDGIPFTYNKLYDGFQLHYVVDGKEICDVICHKWSYGGEHGLLEMMGLTPPELGDDVRGNLTANEAYWIISDHWEAYCEAHPRHELSVLDI